MMVEAANRQDDATWSVFTHLGSEPPHRSCLIAPTNTITADQHHVFGPATRAECQAYATRSCLQSHE